MNSLLHRARRELNRRLEKAFSNLNEFVDRVAATTDTSPTPGQIKSGRYRKGKFSFRGLKFVIENPRGSTRSGKSEDGTIWHSPMFCHYGYLASTLGADSDPVDCFIGPDINAPIVYVVNQVDENGQFDETKSMVGYSSMESARTGYLIHYPSGWNGLHSIVPMPFDSWKEWALSDNHSELVEPLAKEKSFKPTQSMASNAKRGLELRRKHGKGGTAVGVARARDIANRKNLPLSTVKRIYSFFSRHAGNEAGGEDDAGYISHKLWGGTSGAAWARNILRQEGLLEKEDAAMNFRAEVEILQKSSGEEGPLYVYGAVLVPDKFDRQGDIVDRDVIKKAAREYMAKAQNAGLRHRWLLAKEGIHLTQSYIAPSDMKIGDKAIPEGSWVVEFCVTDDTLKKSISSGEYRAFSVGGRAKRTLVDE